MAVRTFKTELDNGYELVRVLEGTLERAFVSSEQHKILRNYAATAIKAIGVTYNNSHDAYFAESFDDLVSKFLHMVIIQNFERKWFALRVINNRLQVKELKNFNQYSDEKDWKNQLFDNIEIWSYNSDLKVNQYQSINKNLMSIVDWLK